MITEKNIKYTKNNKTMAFLLLEDLFGTVEVIVFPGEYERYHTLLNEDEKVFIRGHANVEEDKNAKIVCEQICTFEQAENGMPQEQRTYRQGGGYRRGAGGKRAAVRIRRETADQAVAVQPAQVPRGAAMNYGFSLRPRKRLRKRKKNSMPCSMIRMGKTRW